MWDESVAELVEKGDIPKLALPPLDIERRR